MVRWIGTLGLLAASATASLPQDPAFPATLGSECRSELLPDPAPTVPRVRPVAPVDLARLRDFGRQDAALGGQPPFSVSPDGTHAAIVLRRGDPSRDAYCIGVAVVPLDGSGGARLIDVGGQFIIDASDVRGIPDLPIGTAEPVTPSWSPDGRWLAYLRRDGDHTRAWRARFDGTLAQPVSGADVEARDVRWSNDGRTLIVRTRPGLAAGEAAIAAEEKKGFLFDRRFWPLSRSRPKPPLPLEEVEQHFDPDKGTTVEPVAPTGTRRSGKPAGAAIFARSPAGSRAWTSPDDPAVLMGPAALKVEVADQSFACPSPYCADGVGVLWWRDDDTLFFLQGASPENGGRTSLLRWRPARETAPTLIVSTLDALIGCQPVARAIVCARETATRPRTLTRVEPATGAMTQLYDPNPEFARLSTGAVERMTWRDADGVQTYGDLVLPISHQPGDRHPLVVVQYRSRGFLRGGVGDEYPIHAFAARGFAVLSVERTRFYAAGKARGPAELMRMSTADFAERRRVLSSVEAGVKAAIAKRVVDPDRIGITGLSDGAATVQFALVNSTLFRAAAMSSCCDEPSTSLIAADRGYSDMLVDAGFPAPGTDGAAFWRRYSLAANAGRLRTPILLQLTDDEFRFALETFVTLDRHRVPIEMYVFADGYHQKWRPAHRLATYERAIDWFDFWLNGKLDPAPAKQAQYARWRALALRQPR